MHAYCFGSFMLLHISCCVYMRWTYKRKRERAHHTVLSVKLTWLRTRTVFPLFLKDFFLFLSTRQHKVAYRNFQHIFSYSTETGDDRYLPITGVKSGLMHQYWGNWHRALYTGGPNTAKEPLSTVLSSPDNNKSTLKKGRSWQCQYLVELLEFSFSAIWKC